MQTAPAEAMQTMHRAQLQAGILSLDQRPITRQSRDRDLVRFVGRHGIVAIEVELTPKAPRRLQGLIRGWRRTILAGELAEVHYLCAPGQTRSAVERAVKKLSAENCIAIAEAPAR